MRSARDTVLELLQGIVAFPFQAEEAAQEITRIYSDWNVWCDIIHGEHGCYHERCACDGVIARAEARGWIGKPFPVVPPLPSVPLPGEGVLVPCGKCFNPIAKGSTTCPHCFASDEDE